MTHSFPTRRSSDLQRENRLFKPVEPAPVDCLVEMGNAELRLIMLKQLHFLGAHEQMAGGCHRLAGGTDRHRQGHIRLIAPVPRAESCVARGLLIRDHSRQPIFVGEADPAPGRRTTLPPRSRLVQTAEIYTVISLAL